MAAFKSINQYTATFQNTAVFYSLKKLYKSKVKDLSEYFIAFEQVIL